MEKSSCYSYFFIESATTLADIGCDGQGRKLQEVKALENSFFNPADITEMLGITPTQTITMGTLMKNGNKRFPFSSWECCKQTEPEIDAEQQVVNIVRTLKPLIPEILAIKRKYNVVCGINIVPHIYNEETPIIHFNREIIEFCYLVGAEIGIDLYVFDKSED